MFTVIPHRKWWYVFSTVLALGSVVVLFTWGLKPGIDFTGGSLLELDYATSTPSLADIRNTVQQSAGQTVSTVQAVGERGVVIRFPHITEATHQKLLADLKQLNADVIEQRFDAIGPTIGDELKRKTAWAVGLAVLGMIVYITIAFHKVTRPVPSWQYGSIAIFALLHDLLITAGAFAVISRFLGMEANASFVAAMLTVFGYSVNDTIIIFDRIRDNLQHHPNPNFAELVDTSIRQTLYRSTNTVLTVLLALFAILLFGGESIRDFAVTLIVGITLGTYSSIFLASPLLVEAQRIRFGKKR